MNALVTLEGRNLDLVRRTVAKDCDAAEFDQFIHICRAVRLTLCDAKSMRLCSERMTPRNGVCRL